MNQKYLKKNSKIFVAGHNGLVGSAICRKLELSGFTNIIKKNRNELDLRNFKDTETFLNYTKPSVVIIAAAKVGGIKANNDFPIDFLFENLEIQSSIIKASYTSGVDRLIFLGSSCIYPKNSKIPIKEEYLLTSELEKTNRPYALAKISGIEMCWSYNRQRNTNYFSVMPTNLYGPNDNYDSETSHVLPALVKKIHQAKINNLPEVEIWGTGVPKREFLHSDDLADAILFLINLDKNVFDRLTHENVCPIINVGSETEVSINQLANLIKKIIGFNGNFIFDTSKPDGTLRKMMSSKKIFDLGWRPKINLESGINSVYKDYLKNI